ncbi:acetyltransferase [Salinimicrobium sp. WS361]|uniref:acetyltransferase n=1 Tax=Salinimicrobium sp. WS361 TaxID=3425123 RepID=UPI003D6ED400
MSTLAIIGSGQLGQQIAHLAKQEQKFSNIIFFDDFTSKKKINGYEVLGKTSEILSLYNQNFFDELIIGIGYKHMNARGEFFNKYNGTIPFANIIHSSCIIDSTVKMGSGLIIYPGCIIDKNVVLHNNILVNIGVVISHDSVIKSHSFISPRVGMAGFVKIGKQCVLGINSTIIDNITICDNVQLGGATVVIKNLKVSGLYVGNPARFIN